jgi:hypothetical protein
MMTKTKWVLTGVGLAAVSVAAWALLVPVCTIHNPLGISYLTYDSKWSVTLYSKQCVRRLPGTATHEYLVLVVRPMDEPAPQSEGYRDSEAVFEVEKGTAPPQVSLTNPEAMGQFSELSDAERQHSFLVMCYPNCPAANVRKQVDLYRGVPVHYFLQDHLDDQPTIR